MCQTFFYQRTEVIPLHTAGILELVDHIMIHMRTGLLIDKRSIASADHLIQQFRRIGDQHDILIFAVRGDLTGDIRQDSQCIIITDNFSGGIISSQIGKQGDDLLDAIIQPLFKYTADNLARPRRSRFSETALQVISQTDESSSRLFHFTFSQAVQQGKRRTASSFKIGCTDSILTEQRQSAFT